MLLLTNPYLNHSYLEKVLKKKQKKWLLLFFLGFLNTSFAPHLLCSIPTLVEWTSGLSHRRRWWRMRALFTFSSTSQCWTGSSANETLLPLQCLTSSVSSSTLTAPVDNVFRESLASSVLTALLMRQAFLMPQWWLYWCRKKMHGRQVLCSSLTRGQSGGWYSFCGLDFLCY